MNQCIKNLLIALVATALLVPACKKEDIAEALSGKAQEVIPEPVAVPEPVPVAVPEPVAVPTPEPVAEPTPEPTPEPAAEPEEEVEIAEEVSEIKDEPFDGDEDMYNRASFEVTCVNAHIDDMAKSAEIKKEIYARYGFTEESFRVAQREFKDRETVQLAIKARMERCTKKLAEGLGEAGAEEEEVKVVKKKITPPKTGNMTARISGAQFSHAELRISVRHDFTVTGTFQGKRENVAFVVPFRGRVARNGEISAHGTRGNSNVRVSGRVTDRGVNGTLSGAVHQKTYSVRYNAR